MRLQWQDMVVGFCKEQGKGEQLVKKAVKIILPVMLMLLCVACKEEPVETESSFVLPLDKLRAETTTAEQEYVWVEPEQPELQGVMPNTVGIIIGAANEEIEPESVDIREEDRGIYVYDHTVIQANEDAERLGVSKVLSFWLNSDDTDDLDPAVVTRFNELLVNKYGCDFVVSFSGGMTKYYSNHYNYYLAIKDMKAQNRQVDILLATAPAYYERLVEDGYFVDITSYLNSTTEGKEVYDAYPEEIWDTIELNDKIYGYMPVSCPAKTYVVSCNKAWAEKLGLDVKEGFSFQDIGSILEKANFSAEEHEDIIPIYANWESLYNMLGYYDLGRGILAKKNEEDCWVAFSAADDKDFVNLCKTSKEYKDKGWLVSDYNTPEEIFEGNYIFAVTACEGADISRDELKYTNNNRKKSVVHEIIQGETVHQYYDLDGSSVYGITTWSEYKDEALKLISLINTEEELVKLLTYGIENEHYTYSDKTVTEIYSPEGHGIRENVLNPYFSYSEYLEPDDKTAFYKDWMDNYEPSPFAEYDISRYDYSLLEKKYDYYTVLYQLYYIGYAPLLTGSFEDVDEAVAEIRRMQKTAGIDDFLIAINKKFANAFLLGRIFDE